MINQVEIHPIQDAVVLRKSGSELLILAHHVAALKTRKTAKDFSDYFMNEALVNRPARKLYENWLRKEADLWRRVYQSVQSMEQSAEAAGDKADAVEAKATKETKPAKKKDASEPKVEAKKATAAKTEKASETKKPAAKAEPKKAAPKLEKKAVAAPKKTTATKTAAPVRKVAIRASKKG